MLVLHPIRFDMLYTHFYFLHDNFLISFLISSSIHWVFRNVLFSAHICRFSSFPLVVDFQCPIIVVRKKQLYDFSLLKFAEICFVPYHMIDPGKCFCALKRNVYFAAIRRSFLCIYICQVHLFQSMVQFQCVLGGFLSDLSFAQSRGTKVPYYYHIVVYFSLQVSQHLPNIFSVPMLGVYILTVVISSGYIDSTFCHSIMTFFVSYHFQHEVSFVLYNLWLCPLSFDCHLHRISSSIPSL